MGKADSAGEADLRPVRPLGVWELSWPTMAAFSLQAVVGLVDLLFVAQLGTDAVAAVGVGGQAHFLTFAFITAVTTGTVALVARSSGAQNKDETAQVMQTSLGLAVLFGAFPLTGRAGIGCLRGALRRFWHGCLTRGLLPTDFTLGQHSLRGRDRILQRTARRGGRSNPLGDWRSHECHQHRRRLDLDFRAPGSAGDGNRWIGHCIRDCLQRWRSALLRALAE